MRDINLERLLVIHVGNGNAAYLVDAKVQAQAEAFAGEFHPKAKKPTLVGFWSLSAPGQTNLELRWLVLIGASVGAWGLARRLRL